jgi:3-hydroxyacyl-[acyl-carrier-protein] dehydratase
VIGPEEIMRVIPHRYPMLLVDRITEVVPGERLVGYKAVSGAEPWYRGGRTGPYPPMLLVESWCQAACVLVCWERRNPDVLAGEVMLFGGISDIGLHGPVLPGDVVEHRVRLARDTVDSAVVEGESVVGTRTVLTVDRVVMARRGAQVLTGPR